MFFPLLGLNCFARTHINGGFYEGDLFSSLKEGGSETKARVQNG